MEQDLFDAFYSFGSITGIVMLRPGKCAFIEFSGRESAEAAAKAMYNCLEIKGYALNVNWAKPKADSSQSQSQSAQSNATSHSMPAPPGMEGAAVGAYALPHMPVASAKPPAPPPLPPGPRPTGSTTTSSNTNASSTTTDTSASVDGPVAKKQRVTDTTQPQALRYESMNPSRY